MDNRFEEEVALKQLETRCQAFLDSNKAAIDAAKSALRGAFILNGAAAVAIIYAKSAVLYSVAAYFGLGAFLACVAAGAAYLTSVYITETWRDAIDPSISKNSISHYTKCFEGWRRCTIVLTIFSYLFFFIGLVWAYFLLPEIITNVSHH